MLFRSKSTGHRNRAIGHMLRNFEIIGEDPEPALDLYFRQCSIRVECRDLAVMAATLAAGGSMRISALPDLPTLEETVPGYQALDVWFGYFGPAGLPQPIVARLNTDINAGLNAADVRAKLEGAGMQILGGTPQELTDRMKREAPIYERIIRAAKIEPQ